MYLILKPESRGFISQIEESVLAEGFNISSRHPIRDWRGLAREIYRPQIEASKKFTDELSCYMWLTKRLFGNSACALIVDKGGDLQTNLRELAEVKESVRESIGKSGSESIKIYLNIGGIDREGKFGIGTEGRLRIGDGDSSSLGEVGRWEDFYFKYLHIPDPDEQSYKREIEVLRRNGILDEIISPQEFHLMKKLQTLVYLGENHV